MAIAVLGKGKTQVKNKVLEKCGTSVLNRNCKLCGKYGNKAAKCRNEQSCSKSERNCERNVQKRHGEQIVEMTALQHEFDTAKASWAAERAALESQLSVERRWRMHYEGIVRTCADGPRDLEREVREAGWPSRRSDVKAKKSVARRSKARKLRVEASSRETLHRHEIGCNEIVQRSTMYALVTDWCLSASPCWTVHWHMWCA
jgi:hypothetical protein